MIDHLERTWIGGLLGSLEKEGFEFVEKAQIPGNQWNSIYYTRKDKNGLRLAIETNSAYGKDGDLLIKVRAEQAFPEKELQIEGISVSPKASLEFSFVSTTSKDDFSRTCHTLQVMARYVQEKMTNLVIV